MAVLRAATRGFRLFLVLVLLALFLWQTFMSVSKFLRFGITVNLDNSYPEAQVFPSVTLCPLFKEGGGGGGGGGGGHGRGGTVFFDGTPFEVPYSPGFVQGYRHGRREGGVRKTDIDSDGDDNRWIAVERLGFDQGKLSICYSYRASSLHSGGMDSLLLLYLNTSRLHSVLMFVHEAVQDVLVPMPLYGSDVIHLNVPDTEYVARSADHFLQYRYVVSVTAYNRRSTVDLPCYQETSDYFSLLDCVETDFQRKERCLLPWHNFTSIKEDGQAPTKLCQSQEDFDSFREAYESLNNYGPMDLYKNTGCYHLCRHRIFQAKNIVTRWVFKRLYLFNNGLGKEEGDSVDTEIGIFLTTGGVTEHTEVLSYDGYDLVGNMGGFLGLFLGASILSVYDILAARTGWIRKKLTRRKKEEAARMTV